jgi:hypothetical protein
MKVPRVASRQPADITGCCPGALPLLVDPDEFSVLGRASSRHFPAMTPDNGVHNLGSSTAQLNLSGDPGDTLLGKSQPEAPLGKEGSRSEGGTTYRSGMLPNENSFTDRGDPAS